MRRTNEGENSFSVKIASLLKKVSDEFFPVDYTCNICGREIFGEGHFCNECLKRITFNTGPICLNCGRAVPNFTERCASCAGEWEVDVARSVLVYENDAKKLIQDYKYSNKRYIAELFIDELKELYIKNLIAADVAVGVPMTADRVFERGFNQSEYLAKLFASEVGIPFSTPLKKRRETEHQVGLDKAKRRENLRGAFAVIDKSAVLGKSVVILDDVMTTGATTGELAQVLKNAGAVRVSALTIASTRVKF